MNRFARRLAPNVDHPIEAACGVRPPGTPLVVGISAGLGALIGSIGGGDAVTAGIGGGAGVIVAYAVLLLRVRGGEQTVAMALVLTADRVELYGVSLLSPTKPQGLIRAIPYAEISDVHVRTRFFELAVAIIADSGALEISTVKRGGGAETFEELRRRIAA